MHIRDRIRELRRVKAAELKPNPRNWRTHGPEQRAAMRGLLAEIGYADALLVRELADGSLELIDGHLRAETTPETEVPVLIVDLEDAEAAKLLATLDPLAGMAGTDQALLAELLAHVTTDDASVQTMLDDLRRQANDSVFPDDNESDAPELEIPGSYQVVIQCRDESEQRAVYERMQREGFQCRVLTL